ncbi:MAG: ketol-acid reductoisomerase [Myxococcota bacterium]
MTTIYHDADGDLRALRDQTVAIVGYGNQGRSQAQNLRDSGVSVIVGNIRDAAHEQAEADGFTVYAIAEACRIADAVLLLIPDEIMPAVYAEHVAPHLSTGNLLCFASGYNVGFGLIEPAEDLDVVLLAPRMIGIGVRDTYVSGRGFPSFVGVHRDATGTARDRLLSLAKAVGSTRAGCIDMSMHDEASLDLFTEQAFGPAFGRVMMSAVELLIGAGYPPEAVLLELYLSGEFAYSLEKIREVGMLKQMDFHSRTSQYGSMTRGARFLDLDGPIKQRMGEVLEQIRDGSFAREWSEAQEGAGSVLDAIRNARDQIPFAQWERDARSALRIGDARD